MRQEQFHPPDAAAMGRLLSEHTLDPTGIVLRLAWRAGLTRDEIVGLTWDQVDFDAGELRLPDRTVPLEDETAEALLCWKRRCGKFSPCVAVSVRSRRRMAPQSLSNLARAALDRSGQPGVRLQDLRCDYIRRQFGSHDWPYVLRVAGISVTTYRNGLRWLDGGDGVEPLPDPLPQDGMGEEFRLWRIMQEEKDTPAGIALWLTSQLGLRSGELVALTWDRVDFDAGMLRLPDRALPLTASVRRVLEAEKARRAPGDDPHVLLTPRSRQPMRGPRISTLVRSALIRGGIDNRSLCDFRRDAGLEDEKRRLLDYAREHGSVSRGEAMELLGATGGAACRRLSALTEGGELVRINARYYPADRVVRPEDQSAAVRRHIAENGPAYVQDIADLLHIDKRTTARLLKRMVAAGELVLLRRAKRYALPEVEKVTILQSSDK